MAKILKNYFVFFNANKKVDTLISQVPFLAQPAHTCSYILDKETLRNIGRIEALSTQVRCLMCVFKMYVYTDAHKHTYISDYNT